MDSISDAGMVTLMEINNKIEFLNEQLEKEQKLRKEQLERKEKLQIEQLEKKKNCAWKKLKNSKVNLTEPGT